MSIVKIGSPEKISVIKSGMNDKEVKDFLKEVKDNVETATGVLPRLLNNETKPDPK